MVNFSDEFNRPDGTPLAAPWINVRGVWETKNNRAHVGVPVTPPDPNYGITGIQIAAINDQPNGVLQGTFAVPTNLFGFQDFLIFRCRDRDTWIGLKANGNLYWFLSGVQVDSGLAGDTFLTPGDVAKVVLVPGGFSLFKNGTHLSDWGDSTHGAFTMHGIGSESTVTDVYWDSFSWAGAIAPIIPALPDSALTAEVRAEARLVPGIRMDGG